MYNASSNDSIISERSDNDSIAKRLKTTAYVAIFVLSIVGNSLVLIVMKKNINGARKVVTNILIAHLASADLLSTVFGIPVMIWRIWKGDEWINESISGKILCKLDPFILETAFAMSALTITLIATERFLVIYFPTRKLVTCNRALGVGLLMWFASAGFYSPKLYTLTVTTLQGVVVCVAQDHLVYPWRKIEIVLFVILLLLTLIFYVAIITKIRRVYKSTNRQPGQRDERRNKMNRRVLIQSSVIVIVHYFCWMPYLFIYLSCLFSESTLDLCHSRLLIRFLALFFGYCNAAANPLIYATLSESFRSGFRQILYEIFHHSSDIESQAQQPNPRIVALIPMPDDYYLQSTDSQMAPKPVIHMVNTLKNPDIIGQNNRADVTV